MIDALERDCREMVALLNRVASALDLSPAQSGQDRDARSIRGPAVLAVILGRDVDINELDELGELLPAHAATQ